MNGSSPQVKELIQFEDNLVRIVKELMFFKVKNDFQKMLCEDMKKVGHKRRHQLLQTGQPICTY